MVGARAKGEREEREEGEREGGDCGRAREREGEKEGAMEPGQGGKCACKGILYTGAVALITGFADGAGQIWLDNVRCVGTETRLIDCPAGTLGANACGHS